MTQTIGQTIRKLRKERNFTQEQLAEQLNISAQAVSKWENGTSLPDISQVVPIAKVFGVSIDVLFGTFGTNDEEDVLRIIREAWELKTSPSTFEGVSKAYAALCEGLKTYPNNIILLVNCLECGACLAYPDNGELYDVENGRTIYEECIRQANLITSYSKNTTDVLRAHMIMVMLHAAYGNFEQAKKHAEAFPWRSDMTGPQMQASIAYFAKNYQNQVFWHQYDFSLHLRALLDSVIQLAIAYNLTDDTDNALASCRKIFDLIRTVFDPEDAIPCLHNSDWANTYEYMAEIYLRRGENERAMECLEEMVEFDVTLGGRLKERPVIHTPLLRDMKEYDVELRFVRSKKAALAALHAPVFEPLQQDERFRRMVERVKLAEGLRD